MKIYQFDASNRITGYFEADDGYTVGAGELDASLLVGNAAENSPLWNNQKTPLYEYDGVDSIAARAGADVSADETDDILNIGRREDSFRDYGAYRSALKAAYAAQGSSFSTLNAEEQEIIATNKICSQSEVEGFYGDIYVQIKSLVPYHEKSRAYRKARYLAAETYVRNALREAGGGFPAVAFEFMGIVHAPLAQKPDETMRDAYINHGYDGVTYGSPVAGLLDYVEGTDGTPYSSNGIKKRTDTPPELVSLWAQVSDDLIAILRDGVY